MPLVTMAACRRPALAWLVATGLCLVGGVPCAAAGKNVLILSEGPGLPYALVLRASLTAAMHQDGDEPLNIYEEAIDTLRFQSEEYERQLAALYRTKYVNAPPDLLIALSLPALDFALRHRHELFPHAALLFGALDERAILSRDLGPNVTGMFVKVDARATVEAALRLHPDTRHVVVVGGTSRLDRGWLEPIQGDVRALESRAAITQITDKPLREVLAAVAALRENELVLFVSMNVDGDGVQRSSVEVIEAMRKATTAPIYGMSDNHLGHGIVGGVLLDLQRHGTELGKRARQILTGTPAADLVPMPSANTLAFDWRELRRFGVDEALLPVGARVVNRELSLWELYWRPILTVSAVLIGQFLLISGLLVQRHRRRRAESALHDLSGRLLSAQEEERRRIARELHDNVSQQVAMLAIRIDQVAKSPGEPPAAVAHSMRELRQRTVEISTEIQNLSRQLHSSRLEILGLAEALRGHCQELSTQGLEAHFHEENVPPSLPHDVSLGLFRIAQEGLNNVVKHSGAREAQVILRGKEGVLQLSVADFGRGFEQADAAAKGGLGLASMRERLRLINGAFTVSSQPGEGTTITARVPIPEVSGKKKAGTERVA